MVGASPTVTVMGKKVRIAGLGVGSLVLVLGLPKVASAHGIGGRLDLPVPIELMIVGAAMVLVVSFVALALLWPEPRLQAGPDYTSAPRTSRIRGLDAVLGVLGIVSLALVIGQVVPDLLEIERDVTRPTIAPVMVWVVFWLVVPFASALTGDWYTGLNPWRVLGGSIGDRQRPSVEWTWGLWPASVLLIAFTWLELVSPSSGDPVALGYAALAYTALLIVAMAFIGRNPGLQVFDLFTSYNRLISAISPIGRDAEGRLVWRGWLRSLPALPEWPGLWVFVVAMIGTVSFDGASGTDWFETLTGRLGDTTAGQTLLLVAAVAVVGAAYVAASGAAARLSEGRWSPVRVAQRFAHTLVPIALAYAFAHYFTLVLFEGQQLLAAVSDPFGIGWDLFGTADRRVDFFITDSDPVWYIQVASIVLGHVLGVVLAHDRAVQDFGRDAVRSQYAMLALMIALTTLGLLILSG